MSRPGQPPVIEIAEDNHATRVRVAAGTAEVWIRVTAKGQGLSVGVDEGEGDCRVEWSIRRLREDDGGPIVTGPFVQSPARPRIGRRPR